MKTVQFTVDNHLCISCGICEGICPKKCISMFRIEGLFFPQIGDACVRCGLCFKTCPGKGITEDANNYLSVDDAVGTYKYLFNAWSRSPEIRHYSASGGVTTTLIKDLLEKKEYDVAFVVKCFSYENSVHTEPFYFASDIAKFNDDSHLTTKSRYVPVSHTDAVKYIVYNPEKKVILVGSSCAIRGLLNVIELRQLKRENYLLIGLFCESVMNYNVWDYFSSKKFTRGKKLEALHFKNKESGGWPGNMKLLFTDGSFSYYDKSFRMEVKPYFKPERCLYCVDKLNVTADISLGDNYTGIDDSELGSNTVIIRTPIGMNAWKNCESDLEFRDVDINSIIRSQVLAQRIENIEFADYKQKKIKDSTGISIDINGWGKRGKGNLSMKKYNEEIMKISLGGGTTSLSLIAA